MIKVLIVDDSALVRDIISAELSRHMGISVVGTAFDAVAADAKITRLSPDVLTLDIEMPGMDGLSFLAQLMRTRPMPVVILSSLAPPGSDLAIRALELGAIEVISKPSRDMTAAEVHRRLVEAVRTAAAARPYILKRPQLDREPTPDATIPPVKKARPGRKAHPVRTPPPVVRARPITPPPPVVKEPPVRDSSRDMARRSVSHCILALGASTGGTIALESLLTRLSPDCPGIVITQHMPAGFTASFAKRLDTLCPMEVREAVDGELVEPGLALLAPGGHHMSIVRRGAKFRVSIGDGPHVQFQRPSVDVLFRSVAAAAGSNVVASILTGMGSDGAAGMLKIRRAGGATFAQDKASCVIFGMPKEAIRLDAVDEVVSLDDMPEALTNAVARVSRKKRETT